MSLCIPCGNNEGTVAHANGPERVAIHNWKTNSVRLTVFPAEMPTTLAGSWSALVGQEPDQQQARPRAREIIELGMFERGELQFSTDPNRIDWRYGISSRQDEDIQPPTI